MKILIKMILFLLNNYSINIHVHQKIYITTKRENRSKMKKPNKRIKKEKEEKK